MLIEIYEHPPEPSVRFSKLLRGLGRPKTNFENKKERIQKKKVGDRGWRCGSSRSESAEEKWGKTLATSNQGSIIDTKGFIKGILIKQLALRRRSRKVIFSSSKFKNRRWFGAIQRLFIILFRSKMQHKTKTAPFAFALFFNPKSRIIKL